MCCYLLFECNPMVTPVETSPYILLVVLVMYETKKVLLSTVTLFLLQNCTFKCH